MLLQDFTKYKTNIKIENEQYEAVATYRIWK